MRRQKRFIQSIIFALLISAFALAHVSGATAAERIRFKIDVAPALSSEPLSGRLLIFMTNQTKTLEMIEPDFLNPRSVFAAGIELHNLVPGKPVEVDPDALSFPAPFSSAPVGGYQLMALLDLNHSYTYNGTGPGDLYSEVKRLPNLNPSSAQTIELTLTKRVPDETVSNTDSVKLVSFESPSLTKFWGRSIKMEAGIVLPPSYRKSATEHYPTVYVVHGYEGNHLEAWKQGPELVKKMAAGTMPEMIYVYLNASFPLGHHVFADSVNNGPWGHALTTEFIPYLEKQFRMDSKPSGRLLTGHSSGGWSTLWLQVNYPEVFGGTWSTSPDPVDFHKFTGPDLTKTPPQNFYWGDDKKPYNLIRFHGREIMTLEEYAHLERVEGYYGGQMASFEAVFSPRGADGQPMPIFDCDTGRIDPMVQKYWEDHYDITRLLQRNWSTLGPKLRGRLHIIVGTADTFHLEEAVYLLRDALKALGSDAKIEFIEGRDHFDLYEGGLAERIAREMYAVARPSVREAMQRALAQ
ncbi:MAG: enterochelin esterase [Acidobacteria bacterium]|nr:MAG: enterochelin esterase [Acidobacteriota bacterium]